MYEYLFYTKLYIPVWDKQDKINALVADKCKKIYWIDGVFFYEMKKGVKYWKFMANNRAPIHCEDINILWKHKIVCFAVKSRW